MKLKIIKHDQHGPNATYFDHTQEQLTLKKPDNVIKGNGKQLGMLKKKR